MINDINVDQSCCHCFRLPLLPTSDSPEALTVLVNYYCIATFFCRNQGGSSSHVRVLFCGSICVHSNVFFSISHSSEKNIFPITLSPMPDNASFCLTPKQEEAQTLFYNAEQRAGGSRTGRSGRCRRGRRRRRRREQLHEHEDPGVQQPGKRGG